jgi:DNA-binding MarR family transcriptional regulator
MSIFASDVLDSAVERRHGLAMNPTCNCLSLRQATRRVTQLYDQALAPLDLRSTQYSLLSQVDRLGPLAMSALAEVLVMDRATLGHNVRPLEARGLVQLAVGTDRRSRQVSITPDGRRLLASGQALWRQAQQAFEAEVGVEAAASLRMMLHRVAGADFALDRGVKD